jgi:tetratricopeptide (TPR) repeat protein
MKPIGTITKYYPFIDEESKTILDSLMDESSSYFDFVQRLCTMVLENEVSINLSYLAAVQAWWCREKETMDRIQKKFDDKVCIKPWGYPIDSALSSQARYHDDVVDVIEEAIETPLSDWMVAELHLLHVFFHFPEDFDIPSLLEPLEKAKNLSKSNLTLGCFESLICTFEGWVQRIEGDLKGAISDFQRSQQLAEKHDDSLHKYMSMICQAAALSTINIHESLSMYEELYNLAQDLDVPFLIAEVLNDSSLTYEKAGEYDLAISCQVENNKICGMNSTSSLILSRIYATLGNAPLALEWANQGLRFAGDLEIPPLYIRKARALALLNRIDEAAQNLDIAHSLIMKTGSEVWLGHYNHVSGLFEHRRGDFPAAFVFFETALEIYERHQWGSYETIALLDLARTEIALASQMKDHTNNVTPGKWLTKLERHASERDLPGVRMQASLLRSELYQNHGQLKDAHATLQDALGITDSKGVATLRRRIVDRIDEMDRLIQDSVTES